MHESKPVDRLIVNTYTNGLIGPSQKMLGPLADVTITVLR